MRLQAWLVLEFLPQSEVSCISSFTLWWISTHRALDRGLLTRGRLAQVTQPVTATKPLPHALASSLSHLMKMQILQSWLCWVLCIFLWACGHDQPLWAAQLLQQLLWKQGAAPAPQGQIVQRLGLFQTRFGNNCKKMYVQSGSGAILKAFHLPGVKQELNRYQAAEEGHPQLLPSFQKWNFKWLSLPAAHSYQANLLHSKRLLSYLGEHSWYGLRGGVTCHSEGRFMQRI